MKKRILLLCLILLSIVLFKQDNKIYFNNEINSVNYLEGTEENTLEDLRGTEYEYIIDLIPLNHTLSITEIVDYYPYFISDYFKDKINDSNISFSTRNGKSTYGKTSFEDTYTFDLIVTINSVDYYCNNISFIANRVIEVPYNIRTSEEIREIFKEKVGERKFSTYSNSYGENLELLKNSYNEFLAIYRLDLYDSNNNIKYASFVIYNTPNNLTDFEIDLDESNTVTDGTTVNYLNINPTPASAIYEISKISWSVDDTSVATIDESTGKLTMLKPGNITITANYNNENIIKTKEVTIKSPEASKLLSNKGYYYLFENGDLYADYDKYNDLDYLEFVRSGIKDVFYNDDYDDTMFLTEDGKLYTINLELIANNIKEIYFNNGYDAQFAYLTNDNKLYYAFETEKYSSEFDFKLISNNVKSFKTFSVNDKDNFTLIFLTINNDLYAYGNNIFGDKFYDKDYIDTPELLFEDVKEYINTSSYYYPNTFVYLLNNGSLYISNPNLLQPNKIDTSVNNLIDILYNNGYFNVYYIKNNNTIKNTVNISNKDLSTTKNTFSDLTNLIKIYDTGYLTNDNKLYYFDQTYNNIKEIVSTSYNSVIYIDLNNDVYSITRSNEYNYSSENYEYVYFKKKLYSNIDSIVDGYYNTVDNRVFYLKNNYLYSLLKESEKDSNIAVHDVRIYEKTKTDISVDDDLDILAIVTPYDATNKKILWSVSDTSLASITTKGLLTAKKSGTVTVYALTEDGNHLATFDIKIHEKPTDIKILNRDLDLYIYIDGNDHDIGSLFAALYGDDVLSEDIEWSTSDSSIISINKIGNEYYFYSNENGSVYYNSYARLETHDKTGDVTITATTKDGMHSDSVVIHVVPKINSAELEEGPIILTEGAKYQLVPTLDPADYSYLYYLVTNSYKEYASVTENGLVTALKEGSAYVYLYSKARNYLYSYSWGINGDYDDYTYGTCLDYVKFTILKSGVSLNHNYDNMYISTSNGGFTNRGVLYANYYTAGDETKSLRWTSSDESILKLADATNPDSRYGNFAKDVLIGDKEGVVTITITSEDGNYIDWITLNVVKVLYSTNEIELNLKSNNTYKIMPLINNSNLGSKDYGYESSNKNVVTVDSEGNLKSVGEGTANITVAVRILDKLNNYKYFTIPVKVVKIATDDEIKITNISLSETSLNLNVGNTHTLIANITPSDTTDSKTIIWTSSNSSIVTVDSFGVIKGIKPGVASIIATTSNGLTAVCNVAVKSPINNISLNTNNLTINKGNTTKLIATINPVDTTDSTVLTWTSSNVNVATVDQNGNISAIGSGNAIITVTASNGMVALCSITVTAPITSVTLNKATLSLELKKTYSLKATINPSDTTDNKSLTWSSSNTGVATVDSNGIITAKKIGTAVITVKTSNGKTAKCTITVTKVKAASLTVASVASQAYTGKQIKPSVSLSYNGTNLRLNTDYTLTYGTNKATGKAWVKATLKGNYTGTKTIYFYIVPKKVVIKTPTTGSRYITVNFNLATGATGYQVIYRVKGTSKWTYVYASKSGKKITELTKGKTYEVRVRAYKTVDNKKYTGAWSDTKSIKCK